MRIGWHVSATSDFAKPPAAKCVSRPSKSPIVQIPKFRNAKGTSVPPVSVAKPGWRQRSEIERSLTQFEALNLAGGCLGQLRNKFYTAGAFVIGKTRNDKFLEAGSEFCIANESCFEHDPRDRLGQAVLVLICHHSDLRHGRMFHQGSFDL